MSDDENSELVDRDHPTGGPHILQLISDDVMALDIESDLWDQLPMILFVGAPGPDDLTRHRVAILDLSPEFWIGKDTVTAIAAIAAALRLPGAPPPPLPFNDGEEIVGVVIRNETWMASAKSEEEAAEIQAFSAAGNRLVDWPEAVEAKQFYATDGTTRWTKTFVRRGDGPSDWIEGGEGRIPAVMDDLLAAARTRYSS